MNFMDAIDNMSSGKRMNRPHWEGYYAIMMPNQNYIWSVPNSGNKPVINASVYICSIDDIYAMDWCVVKNN